MWILDITGLVNQNRLNEYTFNPSILEIGSNLFLVSYRTILYDLGFCIHPWGAWSYKVFKNPSEASSVKYRSWLGSTIQHSLPQSTFLNYIKDSENDTTSLCLLTFKQNKFHLLWNIGQLFPGEYNQDARLVKLADGTTCIIYNVFAKDGVSMRARDFKLQESQILFSSERYLFPHIYRNVEKHCFYEQTQNCIQYGLGESFLKIIDGQLCSTPCHLFDDLFQTYGKDNVLISLATPSVYYTNHTRLACGHAKILFKRIQDRKSIEPLLGTNLKLHGKYLYFAFFYEFNNSCILRRSPLFIPSIENNHLPYLLFMSIGLTTFGEKFILSGGEGDVRCKLIIFNRKEIEYCLSSKGDFTFLTERMNIRHVGYFGNKFNCGDDAFQIVFEHLLVNTSHVSSFRSTFDSKASINVLGGGDVVNSYFIPSTVPKASIALSVGVPYQEFYPKLQEFQTVYLRNDNDVVKYKSTYKHLQFIPDITMLLRKIWGSIPSISRGERKIGIILTRTYYHKDYLGLYYNFISSFVHFCELAHKSRFQLVFIPFCINAKNPKENDYLIIQDIVDKLSFQPEIFRANPNDYVKETYFKIGQMSFNICTRFHSHIFSLIHNVPFLSLTCGRKCIQLMTHMPDCLFQLKTNEIDLPIDFDGELLFQFFKQKYLDRHILESRLITWQKRWLKLLNDFSKQYIPLLRKYATNVETVFWKPILKDLECSSSSPPWYCKEELDPNHFPNFYSEFIPKQISLPKKNEQIGPSAQNPIQTITDNCDFPPKSSKPNFVSQSIPQNIEPYSQPIHSQPVYSQPVHSQSNSQPVYSQPIHLQPIHPQPMYSQPIFSQTIPQRLCSQPISLQPIYSQPIASQPIQAIPSQPIYLQPSQPIYSQPSQPIYSQPIYLQPSQPIYSQPSQPIYSQPSQPSHPIYSQPSQPIYSQPSQPIYSQPSQPIYSQPSQPIYSQPSQPIYSQPSQPIYSQPSQPIYSQPSQPIYSQPSQLATQQVPQFTVSQPVTQFIQTPEPQYVTQPQTTVHTLIPQHVSQPIQYVQQIQPTVTSPQSQPIQQYVSQPIQPIYIQQPIPHCALQPIHVSSEPQIHVTSIFSETQIPTQSSTPPQITMHQTQTQEQSVGSETTSPPFV